jgi:sec-independent protein translocase protein TatB
MLFDLGWSELMLIGVVALVFIGPKDLPKALRVAGYWVRKARTLSREFQSSIDQMIREAELDEIRQDLKKASELDIEHEFRQTIDPTGSLHESLQPPELPSFAEPGEPAAPPASEDIVRDAAEAAEIAPPETAPPAEPAPADPPQADPLRADLFPADPPHPEPAALPAASDGCAHDAAPPKP